MRDIYPDVARWFEEGQEIALATVIKTWGSSPRTVGAKMAINQTGGITGSVSGGCVEGAVVTAAMDTLKDGKPQFLHFDVADETAWEVGVACGGEVDIFLRKLTPEVMASFRRALDLEDVFSLATLVKAPAEKLGKEIAIFESGDNIGGVSPEVDSRLETIARDQMEENVPAQFHLDEDLTAFIDVMPPPPTLVIVGGVHIAVALVKIARASGYRVVIVDPRKQFGTQMRFPEADKIIQEWPEDAFEKIKLNANTAVAMLTHDPKIDDPGLIAALPSDAFYVGALGSRKTQAARRERLRETGVSPELLSRLHGPIGLDLGGRSPEEIALAVMAEIIQVRNQPNNPPIGFSLG
jgi:xanthine dehydrogenase accessory factor